MTRTKQILKLLKQRPLTRRQLFDQIEGTVDQIKFATYYLTKKGKIIQQGNLMQLRVNTDDKESQLAENQTQ